MKALICIKTKLEKLPTDCSYCKWFDSLPHPDKGWTDICGLMSHSIDTDQPEEWVYDGNGRPKACPLISAIDPREYHLFTEAELDTHDQQIRQAFAAECCKALGKQEDKA